MDANRRWRSDGFQNPGKSGCDNLEVRLMQGDNVTHCCTVLLIVKQKKMRQCDRAKNCGYVEEQVRVDSSSQSKAVARVTLDVT